MPGSGKSVVDLRTRGKEGRNQLESRLPTLTATVSPARIVRYLIVATVVLQVAGIIAMELTLAGNPEALGFVDLFDIDGESTIPAFFSSLMLLGCSMLFATHGWRARRMGDRFHRNWLFFAVLLLAMAVDESVGFHEVWGARLRFAFDTGGIFYFAWIIPAIALAVAVAVSQLRFLRSLPKSVTLGFVAAAAVFFAGGIGMEMVAGFITDRYGDAPNRLYNATAVAEETLETLGAILLLRTLLLALSRSVETVSMRLRPIQLP